MSVLYPALTELAYAAGTPTCTGVMRQVPEDFQVDEDLGFIPEGHGEHVWLQIRKRNTNTDWLARRIAVLLGVKSREVGYAGMKDRHALTTQWFSVCVTGHSEPDWAALNDAETEVLTVTRHLRKLRRGALRGNHFQLWIRDLQGDWAQLESRLNTAKTQGVPNYFGEQRFGHDDHNLDQAAALFAGQLRVSPHQRGLYLSAARSWLFNLIVSARIERGDWNQLLPGDALQLAGSHSFFVAPTIDDTLQQRLASGDIHPTGPLWGRGPLPVQGEVLALEQALLAPYAVFRTGLEAAGLDQERRALRLSVTDLSWERLGDDLRLRFRLPAGAYASTVLREVLLVDNAAVPAH